MATIPEVDDPRTVLARERTRIASERTLMAWVRTAVSLIAFGFSIPGFFLGLAKIANDAEPVGSGPANIGLFLILLGTSGLITGLIQHGQLMRRIGFRSWFTPINVVSALVCCAGFYAFWEVLAARGYFN